MSYKSLVKCAVVLIAATLLAIPLVIGNPYYLHILSLTAIYAILGMGLNVVSGYTGQIAIGHAAYFAVGAYVSAISTLYFGVPFLGGLAAAIVSSAALGLLVGIPSLKLEGSYLGMATIGFGEIVRMVLVNWEDVTRGPVGISRIPYPEIAGFVFRSAEAKYYLVVGFFVLAFVLYRNLVSSHYGTRFVAVRDSAKAAAAMGIDVQRTKVIAFVFSTAFAGLAGSLYAHLSRYIAPDAFTLGESINILIVVVVGGMGTLLGPIIGALWFVYLRETLHVLQDYSMLIYGLLVMVLMIFAPKGLMGWIGQIVARARRERTRRDTVVSTLLRTADATNRRDQ
jgi:branched-chain amino acid transport system permease protein